MPSYRQPGEAGEFGFMKKCGLTLEFTHIPSGRTARFIGAITDYKDAFSSDWNSEPVYGRMDPIPTFKRTGRVISISWTILNESVKIGRQNMGEVSKLINFLYPNYLPGDGGATTISTAPLIRMRFANLASESRSAQGLVGYLNGFTYDPNIDAGWVKASGSELIAQELRASIQFTVLHTEDLGWNKRDTRTKGFPYGNALSTKNEKAVAGRDVTEKVGEQPDQNPGDADASQRQEDSGEKNKNNEEFLDAVARQLTEDDRN